MPKKRRDRSRRPARAAASRSPKRRLLVVCEGKVTEPGYIRGLERWLRNATVQVEIPSEQGPPLALVRLACDLKAKAEREAKRFEDVFLRYDEVWCVFDVDEHPHLNDVRQKAASHGVELAISNPCFELWLLLHFRESPGARHRRNLQRMLGDFIPGYSKRLDFAQVETGVPEAMRRARRLDEDAVAMDEAGRNPSTGMYRLAESLHRTDPV